MARGSINKYNGKNGTSWHIRICTGYDSRDDASSNMQLSIDKATAIKDWFENWA